MLILTISEDFNKLLQNSVVATMASLGESSGIMVMTIYASIVFVVAVLCAEYCGTRRASEMLDMILTIQSCYVGSPQGITTGKTYQIQSSKVILFA